MNSLIVKFNKIQFEYRIFVSFGIVLLVCFVSFFIYNETSSVAVLLGKVISLNPQESSIISYLLLAIYMAAISVLRMWAGSLLTSHRVMAFKVQTDVLVTTGPFALVRNPIYMSDWFAMCGFVLILPPVGLMLPLLFYLHYIQLIRFEEKSLGKTFLEKYVDYYESVPRIIPSFKSLKNFCKSVKRLFINYDGFRHNALYFLFIPGFIIAALTNNVLYAILIGIVGVIDWGIIHTIIGVEKFSSKKSTKKVFNDILYSQCWEDPQMDRMAFQINSDDVVFSITSGGCNVLTFLLDNPKKVIALDLNPYQNYLLELKIAAFKNLSYTDLLEFIGVKASNRRIIMYLLLRYDISKSATEYWDINLQKINKGIIHCGRYEKYMKLLRLTLGVIINKKIFKEFFELDDQKEKIDLYKRKWENVRWRIFSSVFLSKHMMLLLFDKDFFKYLSESFSFGKHFAAKVENALTKLSRKDNYFLSYILFGKYYDEENLPAYLKKENYNNIRERVDRIKVITAGCENYFTSMTDSSISKFNFTNIFEWVSQQEYDKLLQLAIRVAKDDAIITYRNLLVPREHPESLNDNLNSKKELAKSLLQKDRSFIYNNYVIEIVRKEKKWDTILHRLNAEKN